MALISLFILSICPSNNAKEGSHNVGVKKVFSDEEDNKLDESMSRASCWSGHQTALLGD